MERVVESLVGLPDRAARALGVEVGVGGAVFGAHVCVVVDFRWLVGVVGGGEAAAVVVVGGVVEVGLVAGGGVVVGEGLGKRGGVGKE